MLREQAILFNRIAMLIDAFILGLSLVVAHAFCRLLGINLTDILSYLWIYLISVPIWIILIQNRKLYTSLRRLNTFDIVVRMFYVQFTGSLFLVFFIWILGEIDINRPLFFIYIGLSGLFFLLEKILVRKTLGFFRRRGFNYRNLLIVGTKEKAPLLSHSFK